MLAGGQGAPLAPIYHSNIMNEIGLDYPGVLINIGGVSNITYLNEDQLIGFDTGPGNGLMDIFCQTVLKTPFDKNGEIARSGMFNQKLVKLFENDAFFRIKYPKSIDKLQFKNIYNLLLKQNLSNPDILATLLEFTVSSIKIALNQLPKIPKKLIIVGGGENNKFLIERLKNNLTSEIFTSRQFNLPGEMLEAELIAFIGIRSLRKLSYTFPNTTGVEKPCSGGKIYKANNC